MKDYWMDLMSDEYEVFTTLRCSRIEDTKLIGHILVSIDTTPYSRAEIRDSNSAVLFRLSKETGGEWKTLHEIANAGQR